MADMDYNASDFKELVQMCQHSKLPLSQDIRDMALNQWFDFADNKNTIGVEKFKKYLKQNYPEVYIFLYTTPFEDIPLSVSNDHLKLFLNWRLRIAK